MKRATKQQHLVWRIIKGAVRDTAHVHQVDLPYRFCSSVAKRATGTLSAQMPSVLAAATVSGRQKGDGSPLDQPDPAEAGLIALRPASRSQQVEGGRKKGARHRCVRRAPLLRFLKDAPDIMWWFKHNDPEAYELMQQALKNIGRTVGRLDAQNVD